MKSKVPFLYKLSIAQNEFLTCYYVTDYEKGYNTGNYYYQYAKYKLLQSYIDSVDEFPIWTLTYLLNKDTSKTFSGHSAKGAFKEAIKFFGVNK